MNRPQQPGGATHWDEEAGYYCKRDGGFIWWFRRDPQSGQRGWHQTSAPSSDLDWDMRYTELPN